MAKLISNNIDDETEFVRNESVSPGSITNHEYLCSRKKSIDCVAFGAWLSRSYSRTFLWASVEHFLHPQLRLGTSVLFSFDVHGPLSHGVLFDGVSCLRESYQCCI